MDVLALVFAYCIRLHPSQLRVDQQTVRAGYTNEGSAPII